MFERIQHLTAAMAAGNARAVEAFYREYFDWMYSTARRVTLRDEAFCLDVVQDAVLRVMRTVKAVDCESRFRGWLRLVVQTTAYDLLRAETRRKNREAMAGTIGQNGLQINSDSLQLDWLREEISKLDSELVNLIELRFTQSWSLREIGQKLGLSNGAVDGRLRRALTKLKLASEEPVAIAPLPIAPVNDKPDNKTPDEDRGDTKQPFSDGPEGRALLPVDEEITALWAVAKQDGDLAALEDEAGAYDDQL